MRYLLATMMTISALTAATFCAAMHRATIPSPAPAPSGQTSAPASVPAGEHVIKLTAKRFAFQPSSITVKKGEKVVLEITSSDVPHGFALPDFNVETEVKPGKTSRVSFTADKAGDFTFACNIFCGSGHEEMSGTLKVTE